MHITKLTQAYYFNSSVLVAKSVLFFPVLQYICLQFIQRTDAIQQCVYFAFNERSHSKNQQGTGLILLDHT